MTASAGALPSYQRFANGVPVPLFTRRSFRPREKYLILLVFLTFGVVCFGAFFFLPDFRTGGAAVNSVYRVYQRMQKAGPELLLPVPPRASADGKDSRSSAAGHPNAVPLGHEDSDHQDVHLVEDKQKLQAKIDEEYQQQKTLEKPDMGESRVRTSSSASLIVHKEETILVTVPPASADKLPLTVGGEDKDHVARQRRDRVKEVIINSAMNIDECNESDTKIKLYLKQLLTALAPLTGIIVAGMSNGYSAILLPQLKTISINDSESLSAESADVNHFGTLTTGQESWIAAASVLPIAPGCWTGGFVAEIFGRRTSLMLLYPFFCLGWLIMGFANSVQTLIAARLLTGYCIGIQASIFPIYVSETSDPLLRGVLLGAVGLTLSVGTLACHAMGTWLNWRTIAYICAVLPIISWITCIFSQESPMWLLGKGKIEEAKRSWIFLRGERSLEEFSLLETTRLMEISEKRNKKRSILRSFIKPWSSRYFLKPFGIVCLYFFVMQFAGTNVMIFYCVEMLADISGKAYAYLITLVIDAIRVTFGIIMCVLVRTCRRRIMTFISGFGVALTLLSLSACLTFDIGRPWIPVILLVTYVALLPLGLNPIPWLLCGELFPRKFRGLGSGLTSSFGFMCLFVVIKTMPAMIELIKPEGTFAVYGSVALLGTTALYLVLPETKNKTLHEIQISFNKKSHKSQIQDVEVPFNENDSSEENTKLEKEMQNDE